MFKVRKSALIAVVAGLCLVAGFFSRIVAISPVTPQIGQFLTCSDELSTNKDFLTVYLTENAVANSLRNSLCSNPVVARQFGTVRLIVGHNDYDTFRYINHGVADLALVKSNVIEAFRANLIYDYEVIAAHDNYSAYFIALREKPQLTKEYLIGKRIGILDYPSSRSGYIIPKTTLQSLGLNDENVSLSHYSSHGELRKALLSGEVDLIGSYWAEEDEQSLSRSYITALDKDVSGMRWYLKMQTRNTDLRCALQSAITDTAKASSNSYYQNIDLIDRCPNEAI
ncbi:PhnD/SsuA/transferrin family substrate-binding protein [Salinimonas chungwhensis]|uniref:PhnD/SsuA/transferrin family substrate-binding protein n=1 Tax=Salinimonas chungwhensis TaxID=265425 RepID=UPI00037B22C3|nr:PhnD/SsuA/transferrin family substrate-binding protein [Salinimonas chungwhensis]